MTNLWHVMVYVFLDVTALENVTQKSVRGFLQMTFLIKPMPIQIAADCTKVCVARCWEFLRY